MKVPEEAVQVTVVSPGGTPCLKLTVPYGIPVGVLKAGSNLSPTSRAKSVNTLAQQFYGSQEIPSNSSLYPDILSLAAK